MASMSSTYSNRQDFNYITTFDNPETGPFTFGFTTEAYYKDENQNLLYTAGPATFSDTVTPNWNIPERIAPFTLEIQSNEQPDEYSITVSTDSDGDFVVSITDSNGQTIMDNEVITNSGGPTEIATLPRPEYGEGETYYDIAVYTKGTETYNRSEPELTTVTVYGKEAPEPLAPPTIEITSERADRFMTITNNDENAD